MTDDTPTSSATPPPARSLPTLLTALDARILGVLVEKQATVPDTYPLSLNALKAGCNQKNNRDPVMSVTEAEIAAALDDLRARSLVIESSGSRTLRYEQNLKRVLDIAGAAVPLIAVLMLRGPQTPAELRLNTERMQRFADASSVEAFLRELADHPAGALVTELPRRPGERERRWMHRLVPDDPRLPAEADPAAAEEGWSATDGRPVDAGRGSAAAQVGPATTHHGPATVDGALQARARDVPSRETGAGEAGLPALQARVSALEARVDQLEQQLDQLIAQVGQPPRWG